MNISGNIGIWVGIIAFIAILVGGLEHAAKTDPSVNQATLRPMVEDHIFQIAIATLGVFAIALMGWVALS